MGRNMFMAQPRGSGKTHALCQAAKEIGALFVCHSARFARDLERKHGINAVSISEEYAVVGTRRPVLFDHLLTEQFYRDLHDLRVELRTERRNHLLTREDRDSYRVRFELECTHGATLESEIKKLKIRVRTLIGLLALEFGGENG